LECQIGDLVPSKDTPIAVTSHDGRSATLASATLQELGYQHVAVLEGGMLAWQRAGFPVEEGLSGVMRPPTDVVLSGPDRTYAEMMHYLRWETALGEKYAAH
jgi:3-mercaptopyruvate sulfurtransferase SseA